MSCEIKFTVPGLPIAQPRQRSRVAKMGGKLISQNYTPTKAPINAFKAAVQLAASQAFSGELLTGPVFLQLSFRLDRKKCNTKKRGDNPPLYGNKKPDLDNLMKGVCDSLNGIVWRDDSQVVEVYMVKTIAAGCESPGVDVNISELDDATLADSWRNYGKSRTPN